MAKSTFAIDYTVADYSTLCFIYVTHKLLIGEEEPIRRLNKLLLSDMVAQRSLEGSASLLNNLKPHEYKTLILLMRNSFTIYLDFSKLIDRV